MSDSPRRRVIAYALLAITCVLPCLAWWPGMLSPDSNQTVYQAQQGFSTDWWTAFGAVALRAWLGLGLGLAGAYVVQIALCVGGLYLVYRHFFPRLASAATTLVTWCFPILFAQLSTLSRDGFFIGFGLVAFGLALRAGKPGRARWALIAGAMTAAWLAYLCRQNGLAVVFAVAWLLGAEHLARGGRARRAATTVGAAVAVSVLAVVASSAFDRVADVRQVHPERFLYVYDLVSISELSGRNRFPAALKGEPRPGWVTPEVREDIIAERFRWPNIQSILPPGGAGLIAYHDPAIASEEVALLRPAWRKAVLDRPADYAWTRLRLFTAQLGIVESREDAYIGRVEPSNFGHPLKFEHGYLAASQVIASFAGPAARVSLDRPWIYLALQLLVSAWLLRAGRHRRLVSALLVLTVVNAVGLFFTAPALGFRYTTFTAVAALLLTVVAIVERVRPAARSRAIA